MPYYFHFWLQIKVKYSVVCLILPQSIKISADSVRLSAPFLMSDGPFFPITARVCWKCVFGVFGSIVLGPSRIRIIMKINIFLFEHLQLQDFLDPGGLGLQSPSPSVQDESPSPLTFYCSPLEVWVIEESVRPLFLIQTYKKAYLGPETLRDFS